jgi:hypothetical protein
VGGALGVALLVVILGTPHSAAAALGDFRHLWWYAASMAVLSGLACSLLRPITTARPAPSDVIAPTPARAMSLSAPGSTGPCHSDA